MIITLEHLPESLSKALEARARLEGKSIPDVATEILSQGLASNSTQKSIVRDLSGVAGTMSAEDARAIDDTVSWNDASDLAERP